jgi:hypothetical protein
MPNFQARMLQSYTLQFLLPINTIYGPQAQNYASIAAKNTSKVTIKDWIKKQVSDFIHCTAILCTLYSRFTLYTAHKLRIMQQSRRRTLSKTLSKTRSRRTIQILFYCTAGVVTGVQ